MSPQPSAPAEPSNTTPVPLRTGIDGSVKAGVRPIGGIPVASFTIVGDLQSLSQADAYTISAVCELARSKGHPVVGFVQSTGADVREGLTAAHGWGTAARAMIRCSGIVPTVLVVTGPVVSGPALMLGIADLVVMVDNTYAFVSGPAMVEQFTGLPVEHDELGGASTHATRSGVATVVVPDEDAAIEMVEELLSYLPESNAALAPFRPTNDPGDRPCPELHEVVPASATGSYDVREVMGALADDGVITELRSRWAANLVTAFANVGGHSVGILANQPQVLAGTLDIAASQKGARFVALCDAFNVPLITLVDTPGFQPGKDLEWRGMIRHGAELAFAYARATVPRISITLRKSYGGAYIVMDSKPMGNDIAMAWPTAEIAVMGAKGAVEIIHRRAEADERAELEADYEARLLNPYIAAERGAIDMVIDPADSRRQVADALDLLATKRERLPRRRHDNSPL
ncbi:MAG: carboxyl transferase domain-containing protein [Actinomycetota bacterium]